MRLFLRLKQLLLIFILVLSISPAFAAPHITKAKEEPPVRPGMPIKERLAKKLPMALFAQVQYPATLNILFLRVQFQQESPDDPSTTGDGTWQWCNTQNGCPNNDPDYWLNRSKDNFISYWSEVSYGKLTVNISVSSRVYTLPKKMADYGNESYRAIENLIYESITSADPDIDFSQYDGILIVHAGAGEETDIGQPSTTNDIWSLYYQDSCISPDNTGTNCLTVDDRRVTEAIIVPQTDSQDGIVVDPLGVYLHEFGHFLGLPDLYCTAWICLLDGVGRWSLMGDGLYNKDPSMGIYGSSPAHLDAWSKVYLGWVQPEEISSDGVQRILSPVETSQKILKLRASSSTPSEYFLLENRQSIGFDRGLPGKGLLVWLIDEAVINQNINSNTINNDIYRPGVKLIEADGDWNLLKYGCSNGDDCGSPGDPFPGFTNRTYLNPVGNPSSKPYTPYGWVNLKNINENNGYVSLIIGFGPLPPSNLTMNSKTLSWQSVTDASYYKIYRNNSYLGQTTSTSYKDNSAQNGYIYNVTAVDGYENESAFSNSAIAEGIDISSGGGCFIATAAYGTALAPEIEVLRDFRDRYLMKNLLGRVFVGLYYRLSPPVASYIERHEGLKTATRILITGIVYTIKYPGVLIIIPAFVVLLYRRRR